MGLAIFGHRFFGNDLVSQLIQCSYCFHRLFDGVLAAVLVVLIARLDGLCCMASVAVYNHLAGIYAAVSNHQIGGVMILTAGFHADAEIGLNQVILQQRKNAIFSATFLVGHKIKHNAALGVKPHLLEELYRHQSRTVASLHIAGAPAINKAVFDFARPCIVIGIVCLGSRKHVHMSVEQKGFPFPVPFPLSDKIGTIFLVLIGIHLNIQFIQPLFHG